MALWDELRRQVEQTQRVLNRTRDLVDLQRSPIFEVERTLQREQKSITRFVEDLDSLSRSGIHEYVSQLTDLAGYSSLAASIQTLRPYDLGSVSSTYLESFKTLGERVAEFSAAVAELRPPAWLGITSSVQSLVADTFHELRPMIPADVI